MPKSLHQRHLLLRHAHGQILNVDQQFQMEVKGPEPYLMITWIKTKTHMNAECDVSNFVPKGN
jgi:hypothetical protein